MRLKGCRLVTGHRLVNAASDRGQDCPEDQQSAGSHEGVRRQPPPTRHQRAERHHARKHAGNHRYESKALHVLNLGLGRSREKTRPALDYGALTFLGPAALGRRVQELAG
jgi:hypothetical protein